MKMKALLPALLFFFLVVHSLNAGNTIGFSADVTEFTSEGIVYRRLTFKDDQRTVSYHPPSGWAASLNGNTLRLEPAGKNFAEAQIESVALDQPQSFDEATVSSLSDNVLAALPPGSQQVTVIKEEQNPAFNNNPAFEFIVSYKVLGETFQRSVLFVNTPATQLVFKFTARKSDFEPLYRAFRSSVFTWEVAAGDPKP